MARIAGGFRVRSRECELRFGMARDGECRLLETVRRVTFLALIRIRRRGELAIVRVGVAFGASQFGGLKLRVAAGVGMALFAGDFAMLAVEMKRRELMRIPGEQRRLESCLVVARRAIFAGELALVFILMAARTAVMGDCAMKVGVAMAARAG